MKKRWKLSLLLISIISVSVFFRSQLLHWAIAHNVLSTNNISLLAKIDKNEFNKIQYHYNVIGSPPWFTAAQYLAKSNADIALSLAYYYLSIAQHRNAMLWFKQAFEQGNALAAKPLARYYLNNEQMYHALSIAKSEADHFWAQAMKVNIAISEGEIAEITHLVDKLKLSTQGGLLVNELQKYQIIPSATSMVTSFPPSCLSIQVFATTLDDLKKSSELIQEVKGTVVGRHFCFSTPRYISKKALACHYDSNSAIRCDEASWHPYLNSITTRYLGVMLPKGGANVHEGILYLDSNDDVNVFKHELLHLAGFIDEYPLPRDHPFCNSVGKKSSSHNIVVLEASYKGLRQYVRQKVLKQIPWAKLIKPTTPILSKVNSGWKVETPSSFENTIGLFPAKTCANSRYISVKPLIKQTTLTYNELPLPPLYQDFLSMKGEQFRMPSFHYNIALALEKSGKTLNAQQWFDKVIY
ncbi:hypothetical protein ACOYR1_11385 [Thalassotalea piscium]